MLTIRPFRTSDAAAVDHLFGYAGMQYDRSTGLNFDQARYYDPATGRFVNQDPSGFKAGDSDLYRYAGNDPTTLTDPSGLSPVESLGGSASNTDNPEAALSEPVPTLDMNLIRKGRAWNAQREYLQMAQDEATAAEMESRYSLTEMALEQMSATNEANPSGIEDDFTSSAINRSYSPVCVV